MKVARSATERSNVLMQPVPSPSQDSVPILHRAGVRREVVVLGDRHVDELVGLDQGLVDGPLVQRLAGQPHLAKAMRRR